MLFIGLCLAPGAEAQMEGIDTGAIGSPISQIVVSGNDRTQEKWVLDWAGIQPGEVLSLQSLQRARQEILDTDLFKSVELRTERTENGELILHIILQERFYWLMLPRLSRNADGDIKYGIQLQAFNLQGADRSLELVAQQERASNGNESKETRLSYNLPFYASPYELFWSLAHKIEYVEIDDFDNTETTSQASTVMRRDFDVDYFEVPLELGTGLVFEKRHLDAPYPESIEAPDAGTYNRLFLSLTLDDLHSERYREFGSYYTIGFARGLDWLGSDYESEFVEFRMVGKQRLNLYDNFNYRLVVSASSKSPYNYPRFDIGGGSTVRGLENIGIRGDARLFANLEYIWAYRRHPGLRHTLFLDLGNVYDDIGELDPGDLNYTVGTGFRWKIEAFVRTDLYIDYGYDPERQFGKFYAGTSLIF